MLFLRNLKHLRSYFSKVSFETDIHAFVVLLIAAVLHDVGRAFFGINFLLAVFIDLDKTYDMVWRHYMNAIL